MRKSLKKMMSGVLAISLTVSSWGIASSVTMRGAEAADSIVINEENFPSSIVRASAASADESGNNDGILDPSEAETVSSLRVDNDFAEGDLDNLSKYLTIFSKLKTLTVGTVTTESLTITENIKTLNIEADYDGVVDIVGGSGLESVTYWGGNKGKLDFTKAKGYSSLKEIHVYGSEITNVVIPNQEKIQRVDVSSTAITNLDVSKCKKMTSLQCYNNKLKKLNISANKNLKEVGASYNQIASFDIGKNTKLDCVVANDNKIKAVNSKKNKKLKRLEVADNKLTSIDTSKNTQLEILNVSGNKLKKLDVSKNTKLTDLSCSDNKISAIKVKKGNVISRLAVGGNKFKKIAFSDYKKLAYFEVGSTYSLLEDLAYNEKISVTMDLSKKATHTLTKYLPKMKGCKFELAFGGSEQYSLTEDGVLKLSKEAEDGVHYFRVKMIKGKKEMPLYLRYNWNWR